MKRFKFAKGFVLGITTCLILSSTLVFANASSVGKQLTAFYDGIKIVINGETVQPKDANGNIVEPFIVDGTTYLPVRAISEALGKEVSWDGKTSTVYIGANAQINQPTIWLNKIEPLSGYSMDSNAGSIKDNAGKSYDNHISQLAAEGAVYAVNCQYSTLTGKLIILNSDKDTQISYRLKVYADDKLVYTSAPMTRGSSVQEFKVDINNSAKIKLIWEYNVKDGQIDNNNFYESHGGQDTAIVDAGLWE